MGLLDIPAPLFNWLDAALSALPAGYRLLLWGAMCGVGSMLLYAMLSPQARIVAGRERQVAARQRLDAFDGPLSESWPLVREVLASAFAQLGRVIGPALLSGVPVLCVMVWASTHFGHYLPDAPATVAITVLPDKLQGEWADPTPSADPSILVRDASLGTVVSTIALGAPVTLVEKRRWWNALVGNPAGYLPGDGPAERLEVNLPDRQYLSVGPDWARGWEFAFIATVVVVSLGLKYALRIQ